MILINNQPLQIETFPNGESKIILDFETMCKYHSSIDVRMVFENNSDLMTLMFVKKHLDSVNNNRPINLIMSYIPYSRMDRVERGSNFIFTLKYAMEFINDLKFDTVRVLEPHSDVSPALIDNVVIETPLVELVRKCMKNIEFDASKDFIYFPDLTAMKRQEKNIKVKNTLSAMKHRDFETGEITGLEIIGDTSKITPESRVIMVDDLSSFGGTFVFGNIELKKLGFKESYLVVAHAEKSVLKGKLFNHIEKLYTTDSILQKEDIKHEMINKIDISNALTISSDRKLEEKNGLVNYMEE